MNQWIKTVVMVIVTVVAGDIALAAPKVPVQAEPQSPEGIGITAKAGTLGFGGDLTIGLVKYFNLRLGYNYLNLDIKKDDVASEVKEISSAIDLKSASALLDWHPTGMGFRISAGGMMNKNRLALSAIPNDTVQIDDMDFTVSSLDGEITFKDFAPYVGIGYGNAGRQDKDSHWRFSFDLGAMFQGVPTVKLTGTAVDPVVQSALDQAIENEKKDQEDIITSFRVYPVLSFGVSFVF